MKTTLLILAFLFSTQILAKDKIQEAMKTYVNKLTEKNGFLPVVHQGKILKLKVLKSDKYPDGFHSGVKSEKNFHASCADFTDEKGRKYDIDFLVSKSADGFKVVQPIVHSINGKKNRYDLSH